MTSLVDMARRLRLDIVSCSANGALLRTRGNTVSIFPDPRGRAYVNGKVVGETGGTVMTERDGMMYVPTSLEQAIRAALVPVGGTASPPSIGTSPVRPPTGRSVLGRVVIDAGHGGRDPGSPRNTNRSIDEKVVNLDTALMLERMLKKAGVDVVMTRRTDVFIELEDRPAVGNRHRADLFVSIHADASPNRSAQGFTVYVAEKPPSGTLRAADLVRRELAREGVKDRGVRRKDYRVVRKSRGPAMLVELGFLTNSWEGRQLATRAYRERLAGAIARGILAYLRRPSS